MFQINEGTKDRDIRLVLGIALTIVALFWVHGIWMIVVGVLAAVMFVTAAIGFCPIYRIFGISTRPPSE